MKRKRDLRISNKIVRTANVTQSAIGDKRDYGRQPSLQRF